MIAAVLDTNVLAYGFAALANPESTPGELLRRWRAGSYSLVTSEHVLDEPSRAFTDPSFARRVGGKAISTALALLRRDAKIQPITVRNQGVATQPADDLVLATALGSRANDLATGDRRLRKRVADHGTLLLSPRAFPDFL